MIGDPTVLGWTIACGYAITAWLCWRAFCRETTVNRARFWLMLSMVLALLALNKQLDLQTLVTAAARDTAKEQGWYASRRPVQVGAVLGGLLLVALGGALAFNALRGSLRRMWPALAGLALIGVYIAVRMTSLHELDAVVIGGWFPMKWWTELLGLALIAWSTQRKEHRLVSARTMDANIGS